MTNNPFKSAASFVVGVQSGEDGERRRLATHDGDSMETTLPLPVSVERKELEKVYLVDCWDCGSDGLNVM